ncbi:MAG: hypothetical protein ACRD1T_23060, partial [Acidimicrobiia bacterium]
MLPNLLPKNARRGGEMKKGLAAAAAAIVVAASLSAVPAATAAQAPETTYYLHSGGSVSGQIDWARNQLPNFNQTRPVATQSSFSQDVSTHGNGATNPRGQFDPIWIGNVSGTIRAVTLDFWSIRPRLPIDDNFRFASYDVRISLGIGPATVRYYLPTIDVPSSEVEPARATHTYTT